MYLASRTVYTDAFGRFFVGDLAPGSYEVTCNESTEVIEI
ncbi:MAG: hypothetical protein ACI9MR_001986, partial [Myxococcota bacterium]